MKRREMIRAASALAASPLFFNGTISAMHSGDNPGLSNVKRFGDGRDWFFQKRVYIPFRAGTNSINGGQGFREKNM
jgi:hypothetical protein